MIIYMISKRFSYDINILTVLSSFQTKHHYHIKHLTHPQGLV